MTEWTIVANVYHVTIYPRSSSVYMRYRRCVCSDARRARQVPECGKWCLGRNAGKHRRAMRLDTPPRKYCLSIWYL